jgi:nucleotide-binding universal stress UspA family protein
MLILAATDFSTRSNRALRQAGLLAQPDRTQLHVVHVVDDDQPQELVRMEMREAERVLAEQMDAMPELRALQARPMVVTGDPFDGILRVAADIKPDLIVMGSHRKQLLLDIFVGTTIERVIRTGPVPVLMVNNEAQRRYENVVAPVDMSDASANALRIARSTGLINDSRGATLLHAFWPIGKGKLFLAGAAQASIDEYVASERRIAMEELVSFLVANDLSCEGWPLRVEEGEPMEVISRAVSEMRPDLLILGTHGRSGLLKALIGSVTEQALRSLNVDILAVPPVKR